MPVSGLPDDPVETDVLVIGSGIAGLAAALGAAREGAEVTIATKATRPEDAASWWAQGGVAVARDGPERFERDILAASDGTADEEAVATLVDHADDAVRDVLVDTLDVDFDVVGESGPGHDADSGDKDDPCDRGDPVGDSDTGDGGVGDATAAEPAYDFGREAGHDEARILHVDAATGRHVHVPFLEHLDSHESVTIREDTAALDLIAREGRVHGAVLEHGGARQPCFAGATVLATGGIGDCYPDSTNPAGSTGDGIAMAALAGADVADMEYVQFHPTVYAGEDPFLVSEAVRGEGAVLRNADGERFMPDVHPDADLAPRDVVARAVARERERTGEVVLDVSELADGRSDRTTGWEFETAFPGLAEKCEERGIAPADGIPVEPAEHFLCGGVAVDDRGRTSLDRCYAVGECARTGVHGANRLASTSLLEGLVWGLRAGADAAGRPVARVEGPELDDRDPSLPDRFARGKFDRLQTVMGEQVGIERTPEGLDRARSVLRRLKGEVDAYVRTRTSRSLYELRNATVTALLVTRAAADNDESVGTHHLLVESSQRGQTEQEQSEQGQQDQVQTERERTAEGEEAPDPSTTPTGD